MTLVMQDYLYPALMWCCKKAENWTSITNVHAIMSQQQNLQTPSNPPGILAEVSGVKHAFERLAVLNDISLSLKAGQVLAILGPNGAGKTTLVNLMLGVYKPDAGHIQLFGQTPGVLAVRQRIGVMLQQAELADTLKVYELIRQFSAYYQSPLSTPRLLEMAGLEGKAKTRYGKLSGGEKRRVQFAIALAGEPDLLFLDEPTTGLDVQARRSLWRNIRAYAQRGAGVILTTHYLEEADALADQIVVLNQGRMVAAGTPAQIKQRVSLKQVHCRTGLPVAELESHPLIEKLQIETQPNADQDKLIQCTLLTQNAEALLRDLLQRDQALTDLQVTGAGLEEAFLALTETGTSAADTLTDKEQAA